MKQGLLPASPSTQVLAILLIIRERHLGMKSSGIQFVFWMVLLVYEVIRLRSMSLIHQDDLVLVGWGRVGGAGGADDAIVHHRRFNDSVVIVTSVCHLVFLVSDPSGCTTCSCCNWFDR